VVSDRRGVWSRSGVFQPRGEYPERRALKAAAEEFGKMGILGIRTLVFCPDAPTGHVAIKRQVPGLNPGLSPIPPSGERDRDLIHLGFAVAEGLCSIAPVHHRSLTPPLAIYATSH
jgi:hypothetical protein